MTAQAAVPIDPVALAALEKVGDKADAAQLAQLVQFAVGEHAATAARAAWVLAKNTKKTSPESLHQVAADSLHADARVHVMQAIARFQDVADDLRDHRAARRRSPGPDLCCATARQAEAAGDRRAAADARREPHRLPEGSRD